jgi:hypothetical protein
LLAGFVTCFVALLHMGMTMKGWDFFYYYSASRMVADGHGALIYNLHALGHAESVLARPYRVPHGVLPNVSPPAFAVALAPLAMLPYNLAYLLWLIANCLLLAVAMCFLERYSGLKGRSALWFRLAALCSLPALIAIFQGQTSILNLALLVASLAAFSQGRDGLAGALLALAFIKPQYAPAFLVVLIAQRRWTALAALALTTAGLLIAPIPFLGPSIDLAYGHTLLQATTWGQEIGGFGPIWNRGFPGFARLLLPHPIDTLTSLVFGVCALALLAWAAFRTRRVEIAFALAVVVSLLVSPHVLIHDLTLLLVPVAVALRFGAEGPPRLTSVLLASYLAITGGFALVFVAPLQLSAPAMAALGVWLYRAAVDRSRVSLRPLTVRPAPTAVGRDAAAR